MQESLRRPAYPLDYFRKSLPGDSQLMGAIDVSAFCGLPPSISRAKVERICSVPDKE